MPQARQLPTYICEPTNEHAGTSGYEARKIYRDTESVTHYSSAATMLQAISDDLGDGSSAIGGLVYLKNGIYNIDTDSGGGGNYVAWSNETDGPDVTIQVVGETKQNTIIKQTVGGTDDNTFTVYCNGRFENLTFDGNNTGTVKGMEGGNNNLVGLEVNNCEFHDFTSMACQTYRAKWFVLANSYFHTHRTSEDQCAFEANNRGFVHNNFFDKTTGTTDGSNLTSGSCFNTIISNNVCKKLNDGDLVHGISIEPFDVNPNYDNVMISNNTVINGTISLGGLGAWNTTFRNVSIIGNTLVGGDIRVKGPDTGDHSTQVQDLTIKDNTIINPYQRGILCTNLAGFTVVRDNIIKNSNIGLDAITFDKGLIYISDTKDLLLERNILYMTITSPSNSDFSPYGISLNGDNENPTIQDNRIYNTTVANPSYDISGSQTGNVRISRST